tara:strand:- start:18 stop:548 length:531 start_codon:yes stop_codon:yes gene_type:complete
MFFPMVATYRTVLVGIHLFAPRVLTDATFFGRPLQGIVHPDTDTVTMFRFGISVFFVQILSLFSLNTIGLKRKLEESVEISWSISQTIYFDILRGFVFTTKYQVQIVAQSEVEICTGQHVNVPQRPLILLPPNIRARTCVVDGQKSLRSIIANVHESTFFEDARTVLEGTVVHFVQ